MNKYLLRRTTLSSKYVCILTLIICSEAKIIRDMKQMMNGQGVSKQYGFVTFNQHEHALGR